MDFKNSFYQQETENNLNDVYNGRIVWMTNNDYHGLLSNSDGDVEKYETWGLPSLFSMVKFSEFTNYSEDNVFTIQGDFNNN